MRREEGVQARASALLGRGQVQAREKKVTLTPPLRLRAGQLSYLLHLTSTLSSIRLRALECLRAFDAPYDCEHSCRGMTYAHLVDAFGTASRRRLRRLDYGQAAGDSNRDAPGANSDGHAGGVDFDCKDCSMRWEKVVGTLLEGMDELPECPF